MKVRVEKTNKLCIICKQEKSVGEFSQYKYTTNQGKRSVRRSSRCGDCEKQRRKERYAANRMRELKLMAAYREQNRDENNRKMREYRAANAEAVRKMRVVSEQKRRHSFSNIPLEEIKRAIFYVLEESRFGEKYLDAYTGKLIENPTVDHIIPISRGGGYGWDNLCVTERKNNSSKHKKTLIHWLAQHA